LNPETVLVDSLSRDQEQALEWSGRPSTNE
jgi:hypothetical protein